MPKLELAVMSLRYSSWSIRPYLALAHAGVDFDIRTADLPEVARQASTGSIVHADAAAVGLDKRRELGSVTGLFPVLWVDGEPIHESLAICEWLAESWPDVHLWPRPTRDRAMARSFSSEMATGFSNLRTHMGCHVFARVPGFTPDDATRAEIDRVFDIWRTCLGRSGGPFLFGDFGIIDCMYFPVVTRFRTYCVPLPDDLEKYATAMESSAPVLSWRKLAAVAPAIPAYDEHILSLGGNPDAEAPR